LSALSVLNRKIWQESERDEISDDDDNSDDDSEDHQDDNDSDTIIDPADDSD